MGQGRDGGSGEEADGQRLSIEELERLLAAAVRAGSVSAMRLAHRIHRQREEREALDDDLDPRRKNAVPIPDRVERLERAVRQLLRRVEDLEHDLDQAQSEAGEALELSERAAPWRQL